MSIVVETFLSCDGANASPDCRQNFGVDDRYKTAKQQRDAAKIEGWKFMGGKDFCPECYKSITSTYTAGMAM